MKNISKKIREELLNLKDEKYKEFHKSLCKTSKHEIIGVRLPVVKKLAKKYMSENYQDFLSDEDIKYYEEFLIKGIMIGLSKEPIDNVFDYLDKFVPTIDNWAICDSTCASLKITKKNMNEMFEYLQKYVKSEREYEVRFVLVMYLDFYMDSEYITEIFKQIDKINREEYYIKMAIAWLISVAFVKQRNITLQFLKETNIDDWTYNKAIQKIIESYRVSDEDKIMLRSMKK